LVDVVDQKILEELENDSRKSFNKIAQIVGKTEATVRRRVNRLIKNKVISKFTIDYDVDSKPKIRATMKIEPDFKDIKRILNDLKSIKEVTDIWRLSGDCGIFIKLEIPTIEEFNPLIEGKISQIEGIKIIETCFITDIIK
jgi:DNA-binding Lrp family transcriptional regulator